MTLAAEEALEEAEVGATTAEDDLAEVGATTAEDDLAEVGTTMAELEDAEVGATTADEELAEVGTTTATFELELEETAEVLATGEEEAEALPDAPAGMLESSALLHPVLLVNAAGHSTCLKSTVGLSAPSNHPNLKLQPG